MGKILDEDLIYEILSVVEEIPAGKVASYGQIARLIGWDKNSRLVGKVLSMAEFYGKYPCHRVVNHAGRTAPSLSVVAPFLSPPVRDGCCYPPIQSSIGQPMVRSLR